MENVYNHLIDDYDNLTVVPIEVKSEKDYRKHNALDRYVEMEGSPETSIVLSNNGEICRDGKILSCRTMH